jgi:hypothetical protein
MSKDVAVINDNGKVIAINVHMDDYELAPNEILVTNPAYVSGDYVDEYFYPEQPFKNWIRDGIGSWEAPVPYPTDGKVYVWNDNRGEWEEVVE